MDSKHTRLWTAALLVFALCISQCQAQQCNAADSKALFEFKAGFIDPGNFFGTWEAGTSCCTWEGVKCSPSGRVIELILVAPFPTRGPTPRRDPAYAKPLGATLGDLSELFSLELNALAFDGPMPDTFGQLKKLENLNLNFNNFSGSVSPSIGHATNLKTLFISLYGPFPVVGLVPAPIPSSFCNLVKLQKLQVMFGMTGKIPSCFCRFNQLTEFVLNSNSLSSEIPNCIGYTLLKLTLVDLGFNEFTGPIPVMLTRLPELQELRLNQNKFSGPIPKQIGNLVNLKQLFLNNNSLSGPMPASLGRLTKLGTLDLSTNYLTRITPQLGKLGKLTNLMLFSNKLQGSLPPQIGNAGSQLTGSIDGLNIDVSDNLLSGPIPDVFGSVRINSFVARKNFLSGGFPLSLAACFFVDLSSNFLWDTRQVGTLPGNVRLQELYMANNRFSGPAPSWMVSLITASTISVFDISGNRFTGDVPQFLFGPPMLQRVNASYNMFNGKLPTTSFTSATSFSLDLSHNMISGPIPSSFFDGLVSTFYIDMSFNELSGPLPANSGDFSQLAYLDLSDNQLNGTVPASVEKIPTLQFLDLSHNDFTGDVPSKTPPPGVDF